MKTLQIFLASSEELKDDRVKIADFIRGKLNNIYKPYGIDIELFKVDDIDDAFLNERVEDVCDRNVQASDLLVALFHTKAGKFTIEEVEQGLEAQKHNGKPQVCVYCKSLTDKSRETQELSAFKEYITNRLGYRSLPEYAHIDSLLLYITLQVARIATGLMGNYENSDEQGYANELANLKAKIDKLKAKLEKNPDDEDYREDFEKAMKKYEKMIKEINCNVSI